MNRASTPKLELQMCERVSNPRSFLVAHCRSGARSRFQARDFGEDGSGLFLERVFHFKVIGFRKLPRLEFEIQVPQVVVDRLFGLAQVSQAGFHGAAVNATRNVENIEQRGHGQQRTDKQGHRSVSLLAWSRKRSRSAPFTGLMPSARAGVGRAFQARTIRTRVAMPASRAAKGMIQATRPKPEVLGAATTVVPYFCTNDCSVKSSLSPRSSAAASSTRMRSEYWQPT